MGVTWTGCHMACDAARSNIWKSCCAYGDRPANRVASNVYKFQVGAPNGVADVHVACVATRAWIMLVNEAVNAGSCAQHARHR